MCLYTYAYHFSKAAKKVDPGHESSRESDVSIEILQPKLRPHVSACVPKSKSPN